jgi:hypothetical protein
MSTHEPLVTRVPARVGAIDWVSARPLGPRSRRSPPGTPVRAPLRASLRRRATWPLLAADAPAAPFDPALGEALASFHRRLGAGAPPANVAALAEGSASRSSPASSRARSAARSTPGTRR